MGGGDDLRMRGMDRRMNHEAGLIDRLVADQDVAVVADQLQVRHLDLAEMLRERIDPETVRKFGVAHGDMPRQPLIEAIAGKQPEGRRQSLLAMQPLLRKGRRRRSLDQLISPGSLDDLVHVSSS